MELNEEFIVCPEKLKFTVNNQGTGISKIFDVRRKQNI